MIFLAELRELQICGQFKQIFYHLLSDICGVTAFQQNKLKWTIMSLSKAAKNYQNFLGESKPASVTLHVVHPFGKEKLKVRCMGVLPWF